MNTGTILSRSVIFKKINKYDCGDSTSMRSNVAQASVSQFSDFDQRLPATGQGMPLFCDFDGPIIDVSARYYSTYQLGLAQTAQHYLSPQCLSYPQAPGSKYNLPIGFPQVVPIQAMTKEAFWQMKQERVPDVEIAMRSGLQGEEIDYFLQQVQAQVNHPQLLSQDRLQSGVIWALSLLHQQGYPLILVTLRCQQQVREILQRYHLTSYFTGIYGSDCAHTAYRNHAEHKTTLLHQALENHGDPSAAFPGWMIGDTEADVLAAQALGIPAIALTCGIRSRSYLTQLQPSAVQTDLLMLAHHLLRE